ncbi:MAG: glycosyltransferase family 4 protein [Muribaculum sp.]|nr:glycosyltransferase family 4 protein [Muribaculum sp.]
MHIIHLVSNNTWGGGEQYVLDLSQAMVADGHHIEIITRPVNDVIDRFTRCGLSPVAKMPLRGAIDFISAVRLGARLRQCDEVIIHVHNFKDAIVATRARSLSGNDKVRIVLTRHLIKAGRTSAMYRDLYARLDAVIFVSDLARKEFLSSNPPIAPEKLHVVHNSIAVPRHTVVPADISKSDVPVIMHHGRISPEKGLDILLDALSTLTDIPWILRIAGEGTAGHVGPLKQQARRLDIDKRIEWLGFRPDVHSIIPSAAIGVVPSTWREPFGLAVLDYMSCGVPVVTTDNGAQPEYLTSGKDAILVPPSDSAALAAALRTLLTDNAVLQKIGTAGADTFNRSLSYPRFLQHIYSIYQSVR